MSNLSQTNPEKFLKIIFDADPVAAIIIANHWGSWPLGISIKQYLSAYNLVINQNVVPICQYCEWAVFDGNDHRYCEAQLADEKRNDDENHISTQEVYHRAYSHFGNEELAREATSLYPGDFI